MLERALTLMLNKEPILAIGIILPQDNRKNVSFYFSNPEDYSIKFQKTKKSHTSEKLTVSVHDGDIEINKIKTDNSTNGVTIDDVPAGRNFHWKKFIDVTLPGNIFITNRNDKLLVINLVPLEQYLACVAVSEMSSSCPDEFLIAQSITARSWILAGTEKKHSNLGLDACNDDCCQRYQGIAQQSIQSIKTVEKTCGQVLIFDNKICDARYSKSCGGITESCENVWDIAPKPYLKSVFDGQNRLQMVDWDCWLSEPQNSFCSPKYIDEKSLTKFLGNVDESGQYFRWKNCYTQQIFCEFFSKKINESVSQIKNIDILNRGESGRINKLNLNYQLDDGSKKSLNLNSEYDIRNTLHPSFLYSSAFILKLDESNIELIGGGWGHGVGMCQIGALGMALNDYSAQEILSHYFQGTFLKKLY